MDFNWAVEQMKQGKKVRRPMWDADYYYKFDFDTIDNETYIINSGKATSDIRLSEIEAIDWILHEEPFNLSEKVIGRINVYHGNANYKEEDIKEFINRLREELHQFASDKDAIIDKLAGERFK